MKKTTGILIRRSLLSRLRGAVGTDMFRHLYVQTPKGVVDITDNGDDSCALFASHVLIGFKLVQEVHATVTSTLRDMEACGWKKIARPRLGCVVVWSVTEAGGEHPHIGFYLGGSKAISNSSKKRSPQVHAYHVHEVRSLYWHDALSG
jgi:hypothetical protein